MRITVLCPPHCGPWLEKELQALGLEIVERGGRRLVAETDLGGVYRACLYSRVAARVLDPLGEGPAHTDEALTKTLAGVDWASQIPEDASIAIDFHGTGSWIRHSRFGRQRVKDGIVDSLAANGRAHPELDPEAPDVLFHVHFDGERISLARDLGGGPLHRRGYRGRQMTAPIKENLAAALLMAAGWPEQDHLVDPFCGSGTLVIEAALMKAGIAPGAYRKRWGFHGWPKHDIELWRSIRQPARKALSELEPPEARLVGYDRDANAVDSARRNAQSAGLDGWLIFAQREAGELRPPPGTERGLVISNPPYGERMEERESLPALFSELGERLRGPMHGWAVSLLTPDIGFCRHTGLDRRKEQRFRNGTIDCRLVSLWAPPPREGRDLENRLEKNLKHLKRWLKRAETDAYRVYDADIPEFALAVDRYGDHAVVQEYAPPKEISVAKAERRLAAGLAAIARALGLPGENVHLKTRRPQKGSQQYGRLGDRGLTLAVHEGPARLEVNLTDYLDTGLFLDHRPVRQWVRERAAGKDMLNLFAYTGTATVQAALGGAKSTTSVDLSRTYLDWARRNLHLNGFDQGDHRLIKADCVQWLATERAQWDLILLDPPTFSNSSNTDTTLDIQRDHQQLIQLSLDRLRPGGLLIFSCNLRNFKMAFEAGEGISIKDMSGPSIPEDFRRNQRIHQCWFIEKTA
ncbi:23S rRNA (guanine2445-N2)-methyltransferase / 23S rRNA (guanine2069-N7)-methyltransferase [Natronospira proteinivora]|uniref:Ribosomal RNA large subunit methyltransferase K/L n=1 Tax=Natronospira proteinivora TaxID=1807133 RepID=A0ABT1GEG4_9GAMM|nr:23S rRNA (guanine2445-N2)-methyltransferase / 23S rRNA (guanine2069-N7)-methyltransferase [Natronospira proteinivora]